MTTLTNDQQIELLRQMWRIRFFEEQAIRLYGEGYYKGSTHPYIAQEATALGVCAALRPGDQVLATYRGHGVAMAMGADPNEMMAELLGRTDGLCKGKGGSMHLSQPSTGFVGSNAIVSAQIPIAGGVALANQLDNNGVVTICFFGDGASCEGIFYETCNMAALWKLPLVLVVENNEFAISTHYTESISVPFIAQRAQAFGFPGVTIDGRDLYAVHETALEAIDRARRGDGPTLIEAKTVRWTRHSAVSAGGYGSGEAMEKWRLTDPIPRYCGELISRRILNEEQIAEIESAAREQIEAAVEFALNSPMPTPEMLYEDIFA
ncbi:MAG: thiamine pyrophosphate-dependent dehydrogenase E1 component subunit alpha [Anaerolineae bacterium]|nr:thiamine pyrophosphate-dependent dehydrogenase E1 component subunit alpha [Anaerolineae bacterium]